LHVRIEVCGLFFFPFGEWGGVSGCRRCLCCLCWTVRPCDCGCEVCFGERAHPSYTG
jgi:hypothetical protein